MPENFKDAAISGDLRPRIEQELQRILASKTFHKSTRLRRMLEYMVRQHLAGAGEYLKEYTLGVEVFERGAAFDPGSDPIVRVEASRLRSQVERFYATEGKESDLRIEIPKGGYIPLIRTALSRVVPPLQRRKSIVVLPFSVMCKGEAMIHACALRLKLIHLLTQAPKLYVLSQLWSVQYDPTMEARSIGKHFGVDLVLDGTLIDLFEQRYFFAFVANASNGYNIWSGHVCTEAQSIINAADNLARDICAAVIALDAP